MGFRDLGFRRMEALLDTRNSASAAICERIGMQLEGVHRLELTKGRMDIRRDQRSIARLNANSDVAWQEFRADPPEI